MRFFQFISIICIVLFCTCKFSFAQVTVAGANPATPNGVFATLNAAFIAINASNQAGLFITISVTANTIEPAGAVLNQNVGPWTSLLIQPVGNISVTGNIAGPLIDFNGADNVTVNGINNVINSLTIDNSNATNIAATVRFVNDATNNTITNCVVKGASIGTPNTSGEGAVIFIAGTGVATPTGNDNITISNNDITASSTIPYVIIKGYGSLTAGNDGVLITNNLIHDFFSTVNSHCRGVYIGTGNSTWTLSSNRIYQTADRQWLTGGSPNVYACIDIQNANVGNGNNFTVTNNILGFRNAAGTGYSVLKNGGTSSTNIASNIHVLILNAAGSVNNLISGNVIGGFDLKSSRATSAAGENIFIGIFIRSGTATVVNNQVGSSTSANSILIRSTATTAPNPVPAAGIYLRGTTAMNVIGNSVGGVTMSFETPGSAGSDRISFVGIFSDNTATSNIRNNTVGGTNASNIVMPFVNARVIGIYCTGGTGGGVAKVTGNKIQNIVHSGARTAFNGINSNIAGILVSPGAVGDSIARDTVINLFSTASTASGTKSIVGIYYDASGTAPGTVVSKNVIHSLNTSGGPGYLTGITTTAGRSRISNNMISLGAGLTGADIIYAIEQFYTSNVEAYFNTLKISGTSSGVVTAAFRTNCTSLLPGIVVLKNNIIYNDRIGISYGYLISSFTTYTGDHNLVYGTRFGFYVGVAYLSIATWFAATGQDGPAVSKNSTMSFISPTDLHTTDPVIRNSAVAISGITDDIDNFTRGACIDIGADEFDSGSIPGTTYTWVGGVSDLWCEPCNWDRDAVPPVNADVIINNSCLNYPLLQASCGSQQVNDFTMLPGATPVSSSKMDVGVYTLSVNGNVNIAGICSCSGVTSAAVITQGLLDITSSSSQQILDIKNNAGNYPGELCKLRINKTAPVALASNNHEAILKGNLRIVYHLDFNNGVLLSQTGAGYDADENLASNFKTITILNDDPASVTRQNIPSQNTRNGFFMGRISRLIQAGSIANQYLYPLGYRKTGGTGVLADYFYTPALIAFSNVGISNYVTGTYLNSNTNFTVDGTNIGFTGHGCFNPLEVDDLGGNTAVSCLNKEIDMVAFNYWDFSEGNGPIANGDPAVVANALGTVTFDLECAGDVFALTAVDGLAGSQLRLLNRAGVALPGNAGQGPWVSTVGTHSGINISGNTGISLYALGLLQGARRNSVTQFGGFGGAGNGDSPLPVELLFFDAQKNENGSVLCTWATSSEINCDYFIVEVATSRNSNGMLEFKPIGSVKGAGNSNNTINYSLTDFAAYHGLVYYRLLQVDFNGAFQYSSTVALKFEKTSEALTFIGFSPNPVTMHSVLGLFANHELNLNLLVTDPSGRIVLKKCEFE
ncbi:MAG: hypothetical protein IPP71_12700 [Bacteroidetes bacterium]|nr:hypothetical protein [Bacteroidota bacterium]